MKKITFTIIITFLFISSVAASDLTKQLNDLENNLFSLKEDVSKLNEDRLNKTYPIGSIYISTEYSNVEEVSNAIGGTWEKYSKGKTLVGVDENDDDFNEVDKTGGSATNTLSVANLPKHSHGIPSLSGIAASAGEHMHNLTWGGSSVIITYREGTIRMLDLTTYEWVQADKASSERFRTTEDGAHTHDVTIDKSITGNTGNASIFTNLQPYTTVYMYKRIS